MTDKNSSIPDDIRFKGPWFDSQTAAAYVGCKTVKSWYEWRKYRQIARLSNGMVHKADLDKALRFAKPSHTDRTGGATRHPNSLKNLERGPAAAAQRRTPKAEGA